MVPKLFLLMVLRIWFVVVASPELLIGERSLLEFTLCWR